MEPVSIILTTVGWLIKAIISKTISEGWQRYTKHKKLDEKIQGLIIEFENINLVIEGAQSVQLPSNRVRLLKYLKEGKDLAYESWDILDDLDYFRLQKEVKLMNRAEVTTSLEPSFKSTRKLKYDKKEMSNRIEAVVKKLQVNYKNLHDALNLQQLGSIAPAIQHATNQILYTNRPQTTSYTHETHVYGRDMEINQILDLIANDGSHTGRLPVIAIVGNGGVGKTTLAQKIHHHPKIEKQFDLNIWVCVSTDFDDMRITRQMLEYCSDDGRKYDGESLDNLKRILISKLKGKKVLLVLDDIWAIKSDREWDSLLAPLNRSTGTLTCSTVLVTTRDLSIAKKVKTIDPVIQLDGLDKSSFWSLFKKCAFGDDQYRVPNNIENIGKEIVKKLKGYPLAAKTVGTLLNGNTDVRRWLNILESEKWTSQMGNDDIMPALKLSYDYLPVHLQQCFSYCSLFPKGYRFKADELVHMWMAQDYICTDDKRAEDVGLGYFKTLVDRAFFLQEVVSTNELMLGLKNNKVYVIHDLMHDLVQTVSKEEFLAINQPNPIPYTHSLRHLSFLMNVKYGIENRVQFQNLSSLVIFKKAQTIKDTLNWHQATNFSFRLLILPYTSPIFYNFAHLRYLKLYCPRYEKMKATIPVEICTLYHLQVFELEDIYKIFEELPKAFNNLVNLRHFIATKDLHSMIVGVGRLKNLQELTKFVVREEKGFELGQLSELKELRGSLEICSLQNVKSREEAESVRLSEKEIVKLKLSWDKEAEDKPHKNKGGRRKLRTWLNSEGRECKITYASSEQILEALRPNNELRYLSIENYRGFMPPSWLTNHLFQYLESIEIVSCEAWEEHPNFGQLMCLKELYLKNLPRMKPFWTQFHGCCPHESFPSLEKMEVNAGFGSMTYSRSKHDLNIMRAADSEVLDGILTTFCFKNICSMIVNDCPNLTSLSWKCICMIRTLKRLILNRCSELCFSPAVEEEQDDGSTFYSHKSLQELTISECGVPREEMSYLLTHLPVICKLSIRIYLGIDGGIGLMDMNWTANYLEIHGVKDPKVFDFIYKSIYSMTVSDCPNPTSVSLECFCMYNSLENFRFEGGHELPILPIVNPKKYNRRTLYSLESLQELMIDECSVTGEELSNLLSHLPAIRKLSIRNCHGIDSVSFSGIINEPNRASLEAGVEIDEDQLRSPDSQACLEELETDDCPNMVFVNEGGLSELDALKEITVHGSDKLLISSLNQKKESNSVHTLRIEQSDVTSLKLYSFVALKELALLGCIDLAAVEGPNPPACLEVYIEDCPQLSQMQSQIGPKFLTPVGKLSIDNTEFFSIHTNILSSLQNLTIFGFKNQLEYWYEWTEEQENVVIKHLTALEELTLSDCRNLRSLPSTLFLHPSLKELTIDGCYEIKSLPQRGFPQSLQKLRLNKYSCSEELKSQCSQLEGFQCDEHGSYTMFLKRDASVN